MASTVVLRKAYIEEAIKSGYTSKMIIKTNSVLENIKSIFESCYSFFISELFLVSMYKLFFLTSIIIIIVVGFKGSDANQYLTYIIKNINVIQKTSFRMPHIIVELIHQYEYLSIVLFNVALLSLPHLIKYLVIFTKWVVIKSFEIEFHIITVITGCIFHTIYFLVSMIKKYIWDAGNFEIGLYMLGIGYFIQLLGIIIN